MMEKYLGIPYRKGGRTAEGCDCWGFVRLILMQECDIGLPSYDGVECNNADGMVTDFEPVIKPENWVIVYMKLRESRAHVGLYIDGWVIHMRQEGAAFQPISRLKPIIKGYYRCKKSE